MFEYFPGNYPWSLAVCISLGMGGEMGEIDEACRPLLAAAGNSDMSAANQMWFENWSALSDKLAGLATADLDMGRRLSAADKYFRASNYRLIAERILPWSSPDRSSTYKKGLEDFKTALSLSNHNHQRVEVKDGDGVLPGWLRLPETPGPHPCVIFFDGFDSIKEMHYMLYSQYAVDRDVAVLFIDQHGTGESIHFHGLPRRYDSEVAAGLFVDYLENLDAIDADRIGVAGLSMGGYDAPRAAAREKRLKAAFCVGALFRIDEQIESLLLGKAKGTDTKESLPDIVQHALKVTQTDTIEEMMTVMRRLDLTEVVGEITCPLLVAHGANDRQVSVQHAEWTVNGAVNSPDAELKLFSLREGSAEHCGIDIPSMTAEYCFDWARERLAARP